MAKYIAVDDDDVYVSLYASTVKSAIAQMLAWMRMTDRTAITETLWRHADLFRVGEGEQAGVSCAWVHAETIAINPYEPDCIDGEWHDWHALPTRSDTETVVSVRRCTRCGCRRIVTLSAPDPETGRRRESVAYRIPPSLPRKVA